MTDAYKIVGKAGGVDSNPNLPEHYQAGRSTVRKIRSDEVILESLRSQQIRMTYPTQPGQPSALPISGSPNPMFLLKLPGKRLT